MSELKSDPNLRNELPCGCYRAVIKRVTPAFDEKGIAIFDENGILALRETEDIEEGYCAEHSKVVAERQMAVKAALEAGVEPKEAMKLMSGGLPFPMLNAASDEDPER